MVRWIWPLVVCVIGCGGGAAPAASPEGSGEQPGEPEAPAAPEATPAEGASASDGAGEKGAPGDGVAAAASKEDLQKILQLVLDDEALEPHLHLGQPGRFPLKIAGSVLPQGVELTKATKPVVVVAEGDAKDKPVIVFTEITADAAQATVRYRFDAEGIKGSATLRKGEFGWELASSRVVER